MRTIKDVYILTGIFFILSIYYIQYYYSDLSPPTWDDSWHLTSSLKYYSILVHPSTDMIYKLMRVDSYYPPFFKLSTAFLYIIFGTSIIVALATNLIYTGILILSIYGIGKRFFNPKTGLLAAILTLLYPMIFNYQKWYGLDIGLTSMITLSIYLLLLTDKFRSFKYSIYFGIAFALAILTKWTAIIFIIPIFVYNIYDRFIPVTSEKTDKQMSKHYYILSLIITGIISSIWYIPNGANSFDIIRKMSNEWAIRSGTSSGILSLKSILFYPTSISSIISVFFTAIFLIGLIYLFMNIKRENENRIKCVTYLLLWICVPILILIFEPNKHDRYILPIIGAIAIISAYWISDIKNKKIGYIIIIGILIIGAIQIIDIAIKNPPKKDDWKHDIVLNEIRKDVTNDKKIENRSISIVIIPDDHYINGKTFDYYKTKNSMQFNIMNGAYIGVGYFRDNLLSFNYVITKTGNLPKSYIDITKSEYDFFANNTIYFDKMFESKLPDNTFIIVYKRNSLSNQSDI